MGGGGMNWQSREEWKQQPSEDGGLRKGFAVEVDKAEGDSRELTFKISTAAVDRVGDTISVDGWDLSNFKKNPVVLWAHDGGSLPVAKATKIWADNNALHATAEFTPKGLVRFNDIVFDLYKGGFLNAVSVGFLPHKWAFVEDKERPYGVDFQKQELLEFSAVPIPANPEALIEARSAAGIEIEELKEWALTVIRSCAKPSTKREMEEFLRAAGFSRREAEKFCAKGFHIPQGEPAAVAAPKYDEAKFAESAALVLRSFDLGVLPTSTTEVPKCRSKISPTKSSRL